MEPLREIRNRLLNGWQLSKLHTFEVAARHQSFALAAEELSLSPSAVSHRINQLEEELGRFKVIDEDIDYAESITFVGSVSKDNVKVTGYGGVSGDIDGIVEKIETLTESSWLEQEDQEQLENIVKQLNQLSMKYKRKRILAEHENTKIALFQAAVKGFKQKYQMSVSDTQKKVSTCMSLIAGLK